MLCLVMSLLKEWLVLGVVGNQLVKKLILVNASTCINKYTKVVLVFSNIHMHLAIMDS